MEILKGKISRLPIPYSATLLYFWMFRYFFKSSPQVPAKFWDDSTNRKWFVEWFRKEQSIEAGEAGMEKWYQIVCHDMQLYGARTLLSRYNYSLSALLSSIYPGLPWKYERFKVLPKDSWRNIENVHGAIDHIAKSLDIRHLDDWYRVSLKQVKKLGFYHLFLMNGGLPSILASLYPDHDWVESKFKSSSKRSEQRLLWLKVQELFPGEKVIEEYRPIDLVAPGSFNVPQFLCWLERFNVSHWDRCLRAKICDRLWISRHSSFRRYGKVWCNFECPEAWCRKTKIGTKCWDFSCSSALLVRVSFLSFSVKS